MVNAAKEATEKAEKQDKDVATVAVQIPIEFKEKLEAHAKDAKLTVAKLIRATMAQTVGFDISPFEQRTRTRASKYTTDEERDAAKKASAEKRQNTIKALMEKYKRGEITL